MVSPVLPSSARSIVRSVSTIVVVLFLLLMACFPVDEFAAEDVHSFGALNVHRAPARSDVADGDGGKPLRADEQLERLAGFAGDFHCASA